MTRTGGNSRVRTNVEDGRKTDPDIEECLSRCLSPEAESANRTITLSIYRKVTQRYDIGWMNPHPAPQIPGNTEAQRMDNAVRQMFSVSKDEFLNREAEWKRNQAKKKQDKTADPAGQ
jgi:hypothetical protein